MKYFFIINRWSRNGRSGKKSEKLISLLKKSEFRFDYEYTNSLEHAFELSRTANKEHYDGVVAVGGDGTINRVLNGFFDAEGRRISRAKMGAIHTGTSPDFCMSYGIPRSLEGAVAALAAARTLSIRVGMIGPAIHPDGAGNKPSSSSPKFFGCCANIGLGAAVARASNGGIRKYAGDRLGTLLSLLKTVLKYRPVTASLTIDGNTRTVSRIYNIAAGRTRFIASGIKVRHNLRPSESGLYVVTVRNLSLLNMIPVLAFLYAGKHIPAGLPYIALEYGSLIEVSCDAGVETEFDGDPAGSGPCILTTAPDSLELITGEPHAS